MKYILDAAARLETLTLLAGAHFASGHTIELIVSKSIVETLRSVFSLVLILRHGGRQFLLLMKAMTAILNLLLIVCLIMFCTSCRLSECPTTGTP